jgi:urease accessory protein
MLMFHGQCICEVQRVAKPFSFSMDQWGQWLWQRSLWVTVLASVHLVGASGVVHAHHAMGGQTPNNFWQGFLSGLAHPVIGVDHLAFVIAVGLLAVVLRQGLWLPLAFVGSALLGTGIHLQSWNLPAPEVFISASVLLFGGLLALKQQPPLALTTALAGLAGLFHGYAYGESIIGAEITSLLAYLVGFSLIQLGIAAFAYRCGQALQNAPSAQPDLALRFAGFAIAGMGLAFLSAVVLG